MPQKYSDIDESSFDAEELLNPRSAVAPQEAIEDTPREVNPAPDHPSPDDTSREAPAIPVERVPVENSMPSQPLPPVDPPRQERVINEAPRQQAPTPTPQPAAASDKTVLSERDALIAKSTLEKIRMFSGIVLFFLAAYSLIVTISYFANLSHDQSALLGADYDPYIYSNAGGVLGAWLSHFLLYEWLGIGGFIFIYYVGAISLKLLNVIRFRFWNFTLKCLLSAIAVSIIGGFLVEILHAHTRFYWGGLHGYLVNRQITDIAGLLGAVGVSLIMAGLLVVMFIDSLSKFFRWIGGKIDSLRERRRREQEEFNARREESERQRREEELAEAARQRRIEEEKAAAEKLKRTSMPSNPEPARVEPVTVETVKSEERGAACSNEEVSREKEYTAEAPACADANEYPATGETDHVSGVYPVEDREEETEREESLFGAEEDGDMDDLFPATDESEDLFTEKPEQEEREEPGIDVIDGMVVEKPVIEQCEEVISPSFYDPTAELSHFHFPSLELLRETAYSTDSVDATEMEENKIRITKTLSDYGIPISHIHATVGPTVTLYEIIPAEGVRIAKIKRLEDDIAMSLAALGIRIIAPIPGKGTIGIEVPNKDPQTVSIRSILSSRKFQESKMELPMALGCTISNDVFMADLAKMPHLLVAGATGMGKSVGLNTIIASLLYKKHPAELKFVLVDPKMVEFSLYADLERHYLAKLPDEEDAIITDPNKVVATLNSLCIEMDNRYALLKTASCRNIKEYNERIQHGNLMAKHAEGHRFLPYIVVIVDEFADLIMTAGKEVETPIARIAQKARAVGIHMILATQRPSTNVITGVIKANFPGRIAFRVFQMVDSRTILDRPGANQLIGRGDMLFSNNGKIERVQCAFIDTPEVEAICDAIGKQPGMDPYPLPEYVPETDGPGSLSGNPSDRDPLFGDAARYVVQTDTASTSSLQRRYSIGYNRAGKIMDQLEAAGIVGPSQGGKPRQVLMDTMQVARMLGDE